MRNLRGNSGSPGPRMVLPEYAPQPANAVEESSSDSSPIGQNIPHTTFPIPPEQSKEEDTKNGNSIASTPQDYPTKSPPQLSASQRTSMGTSQRPSTTISDVPTQRPSVDEEVVEQPTSPNVLVAPPPDGEGDHAKTTPGEHPSPPHHHHHHHHRRHHHRHQHSSGDQGIEMAVASMDQSGHLAVPEGEKVPLSSDSDEDNDDENFLAMQ